MSKNELNKIKCVILAGGYGSRFSEETINKPKPLIEIGPMPILMHIIKIYNYYGVKNFIICGGYKIEKIKEYFLNFKFLENDFDIDLNTGQISLLSKNKTIRIKVKIIDTGLNTMTGGRIKLIEKFIGNDENFFMTYGDGLSNVNINNLYNDHLIKDKIVTITAVKPSGRFGSLSINKDNLVKNFIEKKVDKSSYINGGFFVLNRKIFNYLSKEEDVFENKPLSVLAKSGQINAFKHNGFWHCMDNIRDHQYLNNLWNEGEAYWKIW